MISNMKKTYISPEMNIVKLDPALMAGVAMQASGPDGVPTVAGDEEDIPEGEFGNSKGWVVNFIDE